MAADGACEALATLRCTPWRRGAPARVCSQDGRVRPVASFDPKTRSLALSSFLTLALIFSSGPQAERLLIHLRSAQRALLDARLGGEGRIHVSAHGCGGGGCVDCSGLKCGASIGGDTSGACASSLAHAWAQRGGQPCAASASCTRPSCGTTYGATHCGGASCGGCGHGYDSCSVSPRSPLRDNGRGGASGEAFFGSLEGSDREEAMARQREAILQNAFGGGGRCRAAGGAVVDSGAYESHAFAGAGRVPELSCEGRGGGDSVHIINRYSSCSTGVASATSAAPASPRAMSTLKALRATANAPRPQSQAGIPPVMQPTASAAAVGTARAVHGASSCEHDLPAICIPSMAACANAQPCSTRGCPLSCPCSACASPISRAGSAPPTHIPTRNSTGARRRLSCDCSSHGCAAGACEVVPLPRSASSSVIRVPTHHFGVREPGAAGGNASRAALSRTAHSGRGSPMPHVRPTKGPFSRFRSAEAGLYEDSCFDDDSPYVTMASAAWAAGGRRQNTEHRRSSTPATVWNRAWR